MTSSELGRVARMCRDKFGQVAAVLNESDVDVLPLGTLRQSWDAYYFGEFARFDRLLRQRAEERDLAAPVFLPLSISHHNLHRLFEVLHNEIGDQPLGTTRVPERILDLREVFGRLSDLLDRLGEMATPPYRENQHLEMKEAI